jgi:hypothetical protein
MFTEKLQNFLRKIFVNKELIILEILESDKIWWHGLDIIKASKVPLPI